jgi:hypothetical protein
MDMETASPPVSPRVVAKILIIQKIKVTSGTLQRVYFHNSLDSSWVALFFVMLNSFSFAPGGHSNSELDAGYW